MALKKIIPVLIAMICFNFSRAQDLSLYQKALFIHGKDTLRYRVLYPENYDAGKSYPLIVYLHGGGFRGNNNELQLGINSKYYGAAKDFLRDSVRKKYPALVVFPQCPADSTWNKFPPSLPFDTTAAVNHQMNTLALSTPEHLVKLLMDSLAKYHIADPKEFILAELRLVLLVFTIWSFIIPIILPQSFLYAVRPTSYYILKRRPRFRYGSFTVR